jgi:hypothetical protein
MGTVRYVPRETNLMFVGVETGTIDACDSSARVVDISSTGFVADGDDYVDDLEILNLAESDGVPVAELWAAYKREQQPAAIKPNEITAERQGQYSDGTWDYSVTFVLDYATITVAVEYGGEIDDEDEDTVPDDMAESAARILAEHYGIIVAVES